MSKASNVLKSTVTVLATAVAGSLCAAEWLGTASDTYWNTAENWESSTGVPVGNIAFSAKAGDNKTVTLDGNNSFNGTFVVSAGTAESPFVFTATDAAVAASNSLNQTNTSGLSLKGALKVEKGIWNFANDIVPENGYLHLTGGRLTTQYWMPVKGNTTIIVDDGELVTGYREGGEQNNGRLNLAESADGVVTLTQNGGRIRCSNNTNGGNDKEALTVGSQARTTTTVNLNGGEMVVNGKTHIGYGATTKAELNVNGGVLTTTDDILVGRNGEGVVNVKDGFVNSGTFIVAGYKSKGTLTQDGGQIQSTRSLQVGWNEGVEGAANFKGGTFTTPDWIEVGYGKATKARMTVAGGTISLTGDDKTRLKVGVGASSYAELNVTSGIVKPGKAWTCIGEGTSSTGIVNVAGGQYLSTDCDVSLGCGSSAVAKLSIGNGGFFTCGSETSCKWLKMAENANSTNEIVIAEGGVLGINHLQQVREGSAKVVFDGGTVRQLQTDGNNCKYLFGSTTAYNPEIIVTEKGGAIDVNGRHSRIKGVSIGGEGVLTLTGFGTMEFEKLPTCSLNLAGPALVDSDSESDFTQLTVSDGNYAYTSLPIASTGTIDLKGGQLALAADSAENKAQVVYHAGILLVDGSSYSDVTAGKQVSLTNVMLAEGVESVNAVVGGTAGFTWTASVVGGVIVLTAAEDSDPNNYWIGGANGEWSKAANWSRGIPTAEGTAQFDANATVYLDGDKAVSNVVVAAGARVLFHKKGDKVDPSINLRELSGAGTVALYHTGIQSSGLPGEVASTLTLEYVSTRGDGSDSWLKGSPTALKIYAPITGAGYLRLYEGVRFYGDNSGFTGELQKDDCDARFMTPASGFANASTITLTGTLWLWFDEGEITFGGNMTCSATGNRGINMPTEAAEKGVTLVLGNNNGNVTLNGSKTYQAYTENAAKNGWVAGCSAFTLRKVGTGTFVNTMTDTYGLVCAAGETVLTQDNASATVSVLPGATLTAGGTGVTRTTGTLTLEEGAILKTTLSEVTEGEGETAVTTVVQSAQLVVSGDVTIEGQGAIVQIDGAELVKTGDKLTLLSVTGEGHQIVGTATLKDGTELPTDESEPSKVWRIRNKATRLELGEGIKGFIVIIQ